MQEIENCNLVDYNGNRGPRELNSIGMNNA